MNFLLLSIKLFSVMMMEMATKVDKMCSEMKLGNGSILRSQKPPNRKSPTSPSRGIKAFSGLVVGGKSQFNASNFECLSMRIPFSNVWNISTRKISNLKWANLSWKQNELISKQICAHFFIFPSANPSLEIHRDPPRFLASWAQTFFSFHFGCFKLANIRIRKRKRQFRAAAWCFRSHHNFLRMATNYLWFLAVE